MRTLKLAMAVACLVFSLEAAQLHAQTGTTSAKKEAEDTPKLQHFDPNEIDKTLDPCQDFYQYTCSKWNASNPIPADQAVWGTGSGLQYWNENILREALDKASAKSSGRSDFEQKIGDYWGACMDEPGLAKAGSRDLKADWQRIQQMKSKSELAAEVSHLQTLTPGAWDANDNQTTTVFMGFGSMQDFDDASKVVGGFDQGGLALPNRDFYMKDDAKSKEILGKYEAHITKMRSEER